MDANTAERVSQLAKNLKDLHLATTAEEAYERAKDIITGTAAQGTDRSIKELMTDAGMTKQDLQKAKELLKEEEKALQGLKKELEELKGKQAEETGHHDAHQQQEKEVDQDLINAEHDVGVLEDNVDLAEEIQEEDSEKQ